jgi:actin-like protein 6A
MNHNIPLMAYELPDGNVIEVGPERFSVPELLFNPTPLNAVSVFFFFFFSSFFD